MGMVSSSGISFGLGVYGALFGFSAMYPVGAYNIKPSLTVAQLSEKSITPSLTKIMEKGPVHTLEKKHTPSQSPVNKQLACAERYGVDLSECSMQGVFINRTPKVSQGILDELSVDSWDNVTNSDLESIYKLDLSGNDTCLALTRYNRCQGGFGYRDFLGLTNLGELNVSNNRLRGFRNYETKHNRNGVGRGLSDSLYWFDISNNRLDQYNLFHGSGCTISQPCIFELNLWHLAFLNISYNDLTSFNLAGIQYLKLIDMSHNRLSGFGINADVVNLSHNNVSSLDFDFFGYRTIYEEVHELDLSNNNITDLGKIFNKYPNIEKLDLSNNKLRRAIIPIMARSIETIDISRNRLELLTFSEWLDKLSMINVSKNQLKTVNIPERLINIERIDVSDNQLSSLILSNVLLQNLKALDMYGEEQSLLLNEALLKSLFLNSDLHLSFNKNITVSLVGKNYQWMDVKDVFKMGLNTKEPAYDQLTVNDGFNFPSPDQLTEIQQEFLSDLLRLTERSYPTIPSTTRSSQVDSQSKTVVMDSSRIRGASDAPKFSSLPNRHENSGDSNTNNLAVSIGLGLFSLSLAFVFLGIVGLIRGRCLSNKKTIEHVHVKLKAVDSLEEVNKDLLDEIY